MSGIIFFVVASAIVSHGLVAVQSAHLDNTDVSAVCEDRASILDKSGLELLAKQLKSGAHCSEEAKTAILALNEIVSRGSQDVCSMDNINMVKDFLEAHIYSGNTLPHSIKNFALSYFMQISHACKANMIDVFVNQIHEHADLGRTLEGADTIDRLLEKLTAGGKVVLYSGLEFFSDRLDNTVHALDEQKKDIQRLQEICNKELRPVFEPAVRPIVELAHAGVEYPDAETLKEISLTKKQIAKITQVNKLVILCEIAQKYDVGVDEHFEYKQLAKVGVDKIEPKSTEALHQLMDQRSAERQAANKDLHDAIKALLKEEYGVDDAEEFKTVLTCSGVPAQYDNDDGLVAPTDQHKPAACGGSTMSKPAMLGLAVVVTAIMCVMQPQ